MAKQDFYKDWDDDYSYVGGAKELVAYLEAQTCYIDDEDRQLAVRIVRHISVAGDVNARMKQQMDLESGIVFLVPKYKQAHAALKRERKEQVNYELQKAQEAETSGLVTKRTKEVRAAYVDSLAEIAELADRIDAMEIMADLFERIHRMVFNRQNKLDQLSNNYRAEYKSDAE